MFKTFLTLIGAGMALILVACGTSDKTNLGPTSTTENQETSAGNSGSDMMGGCPWEMKDVTMTLTDMPLGISVDFTTTWSDQVDMLRMMAMHMAEMHSSGGQGDNNGGGTGGGHEGHHGTGSVSPNNIGNGAGGMMGGGNHHGMGHTGNGMGSGGMMNGDHHGMMDGGNGSMNMMSGMFQDAVIEALDTEGGARLTFMARNTQKVDGLRSEVRSHFEAMQNGKCPMMK